MSANKLKTVGFISLGCDKNRVDSEKMLSELDGKFNISNDINECEVLVINSCAFLESSRREAIETVFDYVNLKTEGKLEKIILTGCLPQKFIDELYDELVEVDAFLGTFDQSLICFAIEECYRTGKRLNLVGKGNELKKQRFLTTPAHYAYLKIADGCNNHCTYCLIPKIRGAYKSYPMNDLLEEAKALGEVKELILVAQDTTRYGEDLYGENKIVELIQKLSTLDNVGKIRILYCYPDMMTEELINELATNDKIIKYIDIPLQHADNRILKVMNRKGSFDEYLSLINKLKERIPSIAIRSTFITGFPGETEENHEKLKEFLKKAKLFNAGFFAYSREEGTPAYKLKGQINESIKLKRQKELYELQTSIAEEQLNSFIGKDIEVLCDGIDYEKQSFFGRAYFNAPDVDGRVYFTSDQLINQGEYYTVTIKSTSQLDLYGEVKNEFTE